MVFKERLINLTQHKQKPEKNIRHYLNIMRNLNEDSPTKKGENKITRFDQDQEEEKFKSYINKDDAVIEFIDLEVYDNLVLWGGTINDNFKFFYRVTPNKDTSTFEFKYLDGFDPLGNEAEESDEYVKEQMELFNAVRNYYDKFAKYWRENMEDL